MQEQGETDRTAPLSRDHADLFDALYTELRHLASMVMAGSGNAHTLQPTAIVNEAWLKLAGNMSSVRDRHHFYALAAMAMRQVLTDHARAGNRQKRGGGAHRITLADDLLGQVSIGYDLIDFNDALDRLTQLNERHAKVIEMRVLGSLTIEEIADLLGVSEITIRRDWRTARMWMLKELCKH